MSGSYDQPKPPQRSDAKPFVPTNVLTLLHEIKAKLEALAATGAPSEIDLRGFPFLFGEYDVLKDVLGRGEVSATIEAFGATRVFETRFAGVWWITHENREGEIVGESLEITRHPTLLATPEEDVRDSLEALRKEFVGRRPSN